MKTLKLFALAAISIMAVACGSNNTNKEAEHKCTGEHNPLAGEWVSADSTGLILTNCGKAKAINIDSLLLEAYKVDSLGFTLTGKVVSNGDTTNFAETYTIAPDNNNLILLKDGSIAWCLSRPNAKCTDENGTHDHGAEAAEHNHGDHKCTGDHNHGDHKCTGDHKEGEHKCSGDHKEGEHKCTGDHNHGEHKCSHK